MLSEEASLANNAVYTTEQTYSDDTSYGVNHDSTGGLIYYFLGNLAIFAIFLIPAAIIRFSVVNKPLIKVSALSITGLYAVLLVVATTIISSRSDKKMVHGVFHIASIYICYYILRYSKMTVKSQKADIEMKKKIEEVKTRKVKEKLRSLRENEKQNIHEGKKAVFSVPTTLSKNDDNKTNNNYNITEIKENVEAADISTDELYAMAWGEIETENTDKALWAKSFLKAEGDEAKVKLLYLKERVKILQKASGKQ